MDTKGRINLANILRYEDGKKISAYMQERYHRVRVALALQLLNMEFLPEKRHLTQVLELASGDGSIARLLKKHGYNVWGSDIVLEQLEKLKKQEIHITRVDVSEKFPFPDATFDAIVAGDIIEHVFDVDLFFKECYRVLKDGGILIITTPNLAALQDRVCFLLGYSPKQIQPCHEFYKLHIRPFTLKLLCKTYKEYGFEVLSHTSNYVIWKIKKRYLIYSRWLAKVFPGLGRSIIICGRKI